jgi:hypothetical protein
MVGSTLQANAKKAWPELIGTDAASAKTTIRNERSVAAAYKFLPSTTEHYSAACLHFSETMV